MKDIFRFLVLCVLSKSGLFAQNLDSLKALLKTDLHDTTRINTLVILTENENDEKVWMPFNREIFNLSTQKLRNLQEKDPLYFFYNKNLAGALNNFGYSFEQHGQLDSALIYYDKCLSIQEQINDKEGMCGTLVNTGHVYENKGNVLKALNYYFGALKIQEERNDKTLLPYTLMSIGALYQNQNNYKKAIEYLNRSLKINEATNNKSGIAAALINIGNIHSIQHDFPEAIACFERSLQIRKEIDDKHGIAYCLGNLGTIYHVTGDHTKSLYYYQEGLKLSKEIGDLPGTSWALLNIAEDMMIVNRPAEALKYGEQSMRYAREIGYPEHIMNSANILHRIYKQLKRPTEALDMLELFIKMRDSISNAEIKRTAIEKQLQYQYEKKVVADSIRAEEKNKVVRAELNASAARLKQEATLRYALFAGLALILVGSLFIYNRFKVTQKQKRIIEKQKALVDLKQKEMIDSIHYARRIQNSLLSPEKYIHRTLGRLKSK